MQNARGRLVSAPATCVPDPTDSLAPAHDPFLVPLPHHPGILLIHLLDRCNLTCQHCYLDAESGHPTLLPLEMLARSCVGIRELNIGTVYLSGGEPLLHPQLPEVVQFFSRQQDLKVCISTNGTLIAPRHVGMLRDNGAQVQISIDGPEAFHDQFRGRPGAFQRSADGIRRLVAGGVPVGVVATMGRGNVAWVPWLAEWAAGMGAQRLTVQPLLQLGRGSRIRREKLTEQQLCELYLRLSDLGHRYRPRGLTISLAYQTHQFLLAHPCAAYVCDGEGCHRKVTREIKRLVIREDGTVLPEIPTLHRSFSLGNVREGTLGELVAGDFSAGYARFDRLCRTAYQEVMPTWTAPLIPWEEIISERSWSGRPQAASPVQTLSGNPAGTPSGAFRAALPDRSS